MTKSILSNIFTLLFLMSFLQISCAANDVNTANSNNTTSTTAKAVEVIKITNRGPAFFVNDNFQPAIKLKRGTTYSFEIDASGHPFWIKTAESWGKGDAFTNGVTGNGLTTGTITFTVPKDAPDLLFYNCEVHPNMHGRIEISN